jgi:hypothetical protein
MAKSSDESDEKERPEADDAAGDDADAQEKPAEETEARGTADAGGEAAADAPPMRAKARRPRDAGKRPGKAGPRPRPAAQPQSGSLGKSMILFIVIIAGLAGAFVYFGREPAGGAGGVKWKPGDRAEVEITLVSSDLRDLACWSPDEIKERHCAFEAPTKGWSKGDADDTKLLRPYTTTDRVQFLGAGLWSQPALTGKLPAARFAVKCAYVVEGKLKRPGIRWSSDGAWLDRTEDWYTGLFTDCKLVTP